jgi:hypothetical protein
MVTYGTDDLYRHIQEQAARELVSASSWMLHVILDRLRADGLLDESVT